MAWRKLVERIERKLAKRLVSVADPIEMKTEPGTEILIGTELTPDDDTEEDDRGDWERVSTRTPAAAPRRDGNVHIRGFGEVV